jgi:hypothetical protein
MRKNIKVADYCLGMARVCLMSEADVKSANLYISLSQLALNDNYLSAIEYYSDNYLAFSNNTLEDYMNEWSRDVK